MSFKDVQDVKDALVAAGKDLSGPCGAFEITKRVAWNLRATGAGLLSKPSGNNCQGYAVDIIVYPDGTAYDMLIDSGGKNDPAWNKTPDSPLDPSRYRPAIDPQDGSGPPIPPPPTPTPTPSPSVDLKPILDALGGIKQAIQDLKDAHERQYLDIVAHFNNLPQPQAPIYEGSVFGIKFTLTPRK